MKSKIALRALPLLGRGDRSLDMTSVGRAVVRRHAVVVTRRPARWDAERAQSAEGAQAWWARSSVHRGARSCGATGAARAASMGRALNRALVIN